MVIYPLSLHDALPISVCVVPCEPPSGCLLTPFSASSPLDDSVSSSASPACPRTERSQYSGREVLQVGRKRDRKSTRLNSSHTVISYAVFCLKKKTHTS